MPNTTETRGEHDERGMVIQSGAATRFFQPGKYRLRIYGPRGGRSNIMVKYAISIE